MTCNLFNHTGLFWVLVPWACQTYPLQDCCDCCSLYLNYVPQTCLWFLSSLMKNVIFTTKTFSEQSIYNILHFSLSPYLCFIFSFHLHHIFVNFFSLSAYSSAPSYSYLPAQCGKRVWLLCLFLCPQNLKHNWDNLGAQ